LGSQFSAKLEPFLLMAKSVKGAAAAKLVEDATSAPGVFVFSELLDLPNIQELSNNEQHQKHFSLLQLFSCKTYQDYLQNKDSLPVLNTAQIVKLKHLSIVSMAAERRILPYSELLHTLDMPTVRELEDLIIDAIYLDILRGKLDQKEEQLEIEYTMGRDLEPGRLESLLVALKNWAQTTAAVLATLDNKIATLSSEATAVKLARQEQESAVQTMLTDVTEKQKEKGLGGVRRALSGIPAPGYPENSNERSRGPQTNAMDVDEQNENFKGKNRKAEAAPGAKPVRKRNRF